MLFRRSSARAVRGFFLLAAASANTALAAAPVAASDAAVADTETARNRALDKSARFVPVAGLLVYPYSTDEAFGAGLQAGFRRDFALLMFRESFLRSTQRAEDGSLLRLRSRSAFEMSLEGQVKLSHYIVYAGAGGSVRHDVWERTRIAGASFVAKRDSDVVVRPIALIGLVGPAVEANVIVTVQGDPELRFGLGFVVGR